MYDSVSITGTVVLCLVVYGFLRLIQRWQSLRKLTHIINQYPGEKKHWFWGNLDTYPGPNDKGLKWARDNTVKFPTSMFFWYGPTMAEVWLRHPNSLRAIFQSSEPKSVSTGGYAFGKSWIGDGLLLSQGAKWSRNRRLLTPAFHFDILKPYMKVNNTCADVMLKKIADCAQNGESFNFYQHVCQYTFDVILRCAMSYVTDVQTTGEGHPYITSVTRIAGLWVDRLLTPWKHPDMIYWMLPSGREFKRHSEYIHSISEEVIRTRQKTLEEKGDSKGSRYLDFLDVLIQARDDEGKGLTFQEIRDEVDTFLFEGHDTTASGITWTLYSLAEHGQYQRQCQQEIDSVLDGRDSDHITWEDLGKLKFLTQCLKEALRLHSPVPYVGRQLSKDMVIDGRNLPKGSLLNINIYHLHHNPEVWPDSTEYRPSRFDPANVEKMDSFAFAPFSAGPRNCIGQNFAMHEMKTVISRILRRFNLSLDPDFKVEKEISLVIRPHNGKMLLKVEPRNIK